MLSVPSRARKSLARIAAVLSVLWLAACVPTGGGGPRLDAGSPVPVALLVPGGSGQASDDFIARSIENAARLAMADLGGVQIDLRVYSTAGQPATAASAAARAVNEGAKIILGPVYAQEAAAAGVAVASSGVNVLSFSNNPDVAGGNVFVLGPTFRNTADRLSRFAVRQGKQRIMVAYDATPSGQIGRAAIQAAVVAAGGTLTSAQSYEFSQNGIVAAAPSIIANAGAADALFLTADTAGALPLLTQLLREGGLSQASSQFIGLTRWDIPPATLALPGVQGAWFAMPDPGLYRQFEGRYSAAYGSAPPPIAGLAYDGIAAVGALARSGRGNALSVQSLTQGSGFVGVNGIFRLRTDGSNERGLAIAQIREQQAVVIDAAPRNFSGAGF